MTERDTVADTSATVSRSLGFMVPSRPRRRLGRLQQHEQRQEGDGGQGHDGGEHRLGQVGTDGQGGLAEVVGDVLQLGAFFCTQVSRPNRCRVWASQPWPRCTWSTMVGSRSATWVSELTSG